MDELKEESDEDEIDAYFNSSKKEEDKSEEKEKKQVEEEEIIVGIDLGTTNTSICYYKKWKTCIYKRSK